MIDLPSHASQRWYIGGPLASALDSVDARSGALARAVERVVRECVSAAPELGEPTITDVGDGGATVAWPTGSVRVTAERWSWSEGGGAASGGYDRGGIRLLVAAVCGAGWRSDREQDQARGE